MIFVDLQETQQIFESSITLKEKTFDERNSNIKRSRENDENGENEEEKQRNPIKKIHIENSFSTNLVKKPENNFMQMRILNKTNFKSFSINLNVKDLQTSLTFRTFDYSDSYERLEFFGDSILKFLATLEVFFDFPYESEGFLSKKRSKIVSNSFLKKACIKNGIYEYILMNQKTWIPAGLNKTENIADPTTEEDFFKKGLLPIPNKALADVIESMTALYYLTNQNLDASQRFLHMVGVLKYYNLNYYVKNEEEMFARFNLEKNCLIEKFSFLERIIGYKFDNISLLIQAFTHISFRQIINNVFYHQSNEKNIFNQHDCTNTSLELENIVH